jgi:hypothetical protein
MPPFYVVSGIVPHGIRGLEPCIRVKTGKQKQHESYKAKSCSQAYRKETTMKA